MHDPSVLVADIKGVPIAPRAWRRWRKFKDRPSLLEIWHDEPDGRDSGTVCGYREMRWHVHHWRVKFMPIVEQRRRLERCAHCGRRMNRATRFGYMSSDKVWHEECSALGQYRSDRRLLLEVIDRLAGAYGIDDQEDLKFVVTRMENRDQFLLWYRTWQMLSHYRSSDDRWKAPNEHLSGT